MPESLLPITHPKVLSCLHEELIAAKRHCYISGIDTQFDNYHGPKHTITLWYLMTCGMHIVSLFILYPCPQFACIKRLTSELRDAFYHDVFVLRTFVWRRLCEGRRKQIKEHHDKIDALLKIVVNEAACTQQPVMGWCGCLLTGGAEHRGAELQNFT